MTGDTQAVQCKGDIGEADAELIFWVPEADSSANQ